MMHEYTYQDKEVFMITSNRVMYLSYNSGNMIRYKAKVASSCSYISQFVVQYTLP
jgi:hypothetical protein